MAFPFRIPGVVDDKSVAASGNGGSSLDEILTFLPAFRVAGPVDDKISIVVSGITKTVGSGKEFSTIQAAINWFKGKIAIDCIIDVDAGDYDENLIFSDAVGTLTLRGDTRAIVGIGYPDNEPMNLGSVANGGSGTCSLSNSGSTLTVAGSTTNPNFATAGIVNGDVVHYQDNSGTIGSRTVSSVSSNVFTFSSTAPTIGNDGTGIVIQPDRRVVPTSGVAITVFAPGLVLTIQGFIIFPTAAAGLTVTSGQVTINNCAFRGCTNGVNCARSGVNIITNSAVSAIDCSSFGYFMQGGFLSCRNTVAIKCGAAGYRVQVQGQIDCIGAVAVSCPVGIQAANFATILANSAGAINCTTGINATNMSFISATSTSANMKSNTANYSPATSGTDGNTNSIIVHS